MSELEYGRIVVLEAILKERELQDAIWENQEEYSDSWWNVIVAEKNGQVAKEISEKSQKQLFRKLIEIGAMYFAWAEMIVKKSEYGAIE